MISGHSMIQRSQPRQATPSGDDVACLCSLLKCGSWSTEAASTVKSVEHPPVEDTWLKYGTAR